MSKVLIAGCGYVGSRLAELLLEDHHDVWGLRRNTSSLPLQVTPVVADLAKPETLEGLPPDFDFVFYTAAAPTHSEQSYKKTYVDGLNNLLQALENSSQPLQRLFFTSSTAVYAQKDGSWVDETSLTAPTHFTGITMLEAEALVSECAHPTTTIRFGGIYGPGKASLLRRVRQGAVALSDAGERYINYIHRDDCAGALRHLMQLNKPEALYVGVDCEPTTRNDFLGWLAGELGTQLEHRTESDESMSAFRRNNKRCRNDKLRGSGYHFQYHSIKDGYRTLLETE